MNQADNAITEKINIPINTVQTDAVLVFEEKSEIRQAMSARKIAMNTNEIRRMIPNLPSFAILASLAVKTESQKAHPKAT